MKQLFIDVETTGTMHWRHSVHQISGGVYINNELKESFDFFVQPHEKAQIEQEALDLTGLTKEQIMAYPHRTVIYPQLCEILARYVDKFDRSNKFFFCAYNAHFDNQFTRAFFKQCGDNYFGSYFWSGSIDVMVLALEFLKHERHLMKDFKLMTVAKHLGIEVDETKAHDGFYDIEVTKKVYDKVARH